MLMGITIVYLKVDRYHKISVVKIRDMNKVRNTKKNTKIALSLKLY